jgi:hypothetical protein
LKFHKMFVFNRWHNKKKLIFSQEKKSS